jgi:hypothetical protein
MRKVILDAENRVVALLPEDAEEGFPAPLTISVGCTLDPQTGDFLPPPPPPIHPPTAADVNAERDRRLVLPFAFSGKMYDRDPRSLDRITGAATLAGFALAAGAEPLDFQWHGGTEPFAWIANDNSITVMDAATTFAFGREAAAVETRIVFAARALKDMPVIPEDYAADHWWPTT